MLWARTSATALTKRRWLAHPLSKPPSKRARGTPYPCAHARPESHPTRWQATRPSRYPSPPSLGERWWGGGVSGNETPPFRFCACGRGAPPPRPTREKGIERRKTRPCRAPRAATVRWRRHTSRQMVSSVPRSWQPGQPRPVQVSPWTVNRTGVVPPASSQPPHLLGPPRPPPAHGTALVRTAIGTDGGAANRNARL